MKRNCSVSLIFLISLIIANDLNINGNISTSFGNSYDFYDYSENILDLNFYSKSIQGWIQYEYSNPPDIGFVANDIRKFRVEYLGKMFTAKFGDIYEFWGRGLVLNQFDDQITNFDNGTRGFYLNYKNGPLSYSHVNGNSSIWLMGAGVRIPDYNNNHNILANKISYIKDRVFIGLTSLKSNEDHSTMSGPSVLVNHFLKGGHISWIGSNIDLFVEYTDKVSTQKANLFETAPNDTIKKGHGYYQNLNFYFGNWGLSTEYKRYSFDKSNGELTANDYGNQIEFQQMPTLGKEHNSTLLNRTSRNYNFNDERGIQLELNGLFFGSSLIMQYAHLSRNHNWTSLSATNWVGSPLEGYLPSSNISALPYWENYQEINGYLLNNKLFYKIGRGSSKEILSTTFFYDGFQQDSDINLFWVYDTTDTVLYGYEYQIIDSTQSFDTTYSDFYEVQSKSWSETRSFTIPLELSYTFDNGYSLGLGFQYQERKKFNRSKGNATNYSPSDSLWNMYNTQDVNERYSTTMTQFFTSEGIQVEKQFNRLINLTISKASKWSLTLTQDWTNAYDEFIPEDPYFNPLEAIIYGDIGYFLGKRNNVNPPSWVRDRWISAELIYNLTDSQRITVMYGSIKGGLFCANGICRLIPPFNDGLKVSYSLMF